MMYRSVGYRSTFDETKRALSKDIPESWPVLLLALHTMTLRKGFEIEGFEVSAMGAVFCLSANSCSQGLLKSLKAVSSIVLMVTFVIHRTPQRSRMKSPAPLQMHASQIRFNRAKM